MKFFYRISDQSYVKHKLIGASKRTCLHNFIEAFGENGLIIADRCGKETMKTVKGFDIPYVETDLGNAGSLRFTLEKALSEKDDELVYFVEDDYLHLPDVPKFLQEGIKHADYVTLYDHPDKYTAFYDGGESSKVVRTRSSHWRYTSSTCMTFGTLVKTLRSDIEIWNRHTKDSHPQDALIFTDLNLEHKRTLTVCIPGRACHVDLEFSKLVDFMTIEDWAIRMMHSELSQKIANSGRFNEIKELWNLVQTKTGSEKLLYLDLIWKQINS
jgi:hypothetical protein